VSEPPLIEIRPDLKVGAAVKEDNGRRTIHTGPNTRLTPEVVDLINDTYHHRIDQALADHGVIDPREPPDD
jgi:hypothetical protein